MSGIRTELLGQHEELRRQMRSTRRAALRCRRGEAVHAELRQRLERLALLLDEHNRREDELLGRVLPTIDAWGPVRMDAMVESHLREHAEIHRALLDWAHVRRPREAAWYALGVLERIADHMASEELAILGEDTLSDEPVFDSFGG